MPIIRPILVVLVLLLALPVIVVMASWAQWNTQSASILQSMLATVLPEYALNSILLCAMVSVGVISMGSVSALAVTLFDFPGRRYLEWALLLPLAMPAYVVAYAYSDFLQYSGPAQSFLRSWWGIQGALWPDMHSLGGAAFVLSVCLYPYVYLLARTALSERAIHLMEAARLLGAGLMGQMLRVALPLSRPAITAGVALALMETLSDYGVTSYLGVQTFATGVLKAWLVMYDREAAAQLATGLLLLVMLMLWLEQHAQSKMRFGSPRGHTGGLYQKPKPLRATAAALAWTLCALPVLLGFVLPLLIMLRALYLSGEGHVPWQRFALWAWNSLSLGVVSAALAVCLAMVLAAMQRATPSGLNRWLVRLTSLGYAVPGVVIVVGLLLPIGWIQTLWPQAHVGAWLTTTIMGLIWAYLVRFVAVALQAIQSGYARIPTTLDDSARMLGVTGLRLVFQIHWPLLRRPLAAATLLVLVDVMKELPATLMLRPFNTDTLAVMAYQLARDERLGEAALPALALVLVGLVPVILLSRTLRR